MQLVLSIAQPHKLDNLQNEDMQRSSIDITIKHDDRKAKDKVVIQQDIRVVLIQEGKNIVKTR